MNPETQENFDIHTSTHLANGAKILAYRQTEGGDLHILADNGGVQPFVTWQADPATGAAFHGRYRKLYEDAVNDLRERNPGREVWKEPQTFYGCEIASVGSYHLYASLNENETTEWFYKIKKWLEELEGDEAETYAFGTIEAHSIDEALNKIRAGDWQYSQMC